MNIGYDIKFSQEQKLIMTMEMQQSIKLLQMSTYELLTHINKEIEENIVLDSEYNKENKLLLEEKERLKEYIKAIEYIEDESYDNRIYFQGNDNEGISPFNYVSNKETFKEYLIKQVGELSLSDSIEKICIYIIDNLDERGYLDEVILHEIMEAFKVEEKLGEKCICIVQSLEPAGVGARNLEECLILQLHKNNIWNVTLENLIKYHLRELSEGRYNSIGSTLNILPSEVKNFENLIKTLNPKPSSGFFTGEEIGYLIPDIYIRKVENDYDIIMNDSILPKLSINKTYKDIINNSSDREAVGYIKKKIESALFLIKSIQNRENTMYRVMEEIIKLQRDYFEGKNKELKPMTIKTIANNINLHESTVSRAVRDKYVAMHTGDIISMRSFFVSAVNDLNENLSSVSIKKLIKNFIEQENREHPLSDSALCNKLKEKNIEISRRTIAKYREEIGIKSSTQRKQLV